MLLDFKPNSDWGRWDLLRFCTSLPKVFQSAGRCVSVCSQQDSVSASAVSSQQDGVSASAVSSQQDRVSTSAVSSQQERVSTSAVSSQQERVSTSAVSSQQDRVSASAVSSQQDSGVLTSAMVGPLTLSPLINRHSGSGVPSCSQGWSWTN